MKIFLDTAKIEEIRHWSKKGIIDGVTTNPTIMLKDGVDNIRANICQIAQLLENRPVSIEVTTDNPQEIVEQAKEFSSWADNIVVKIPVIDPKGNDMLEVIYSLGKSGIRVNVTALMSFNQAILAVKAGANFISIFAGRVCDEGHDAATLIQQIRNWLDSWNYRSEIIVGSIRSVMDIQLAAINGAHIITIPPKFMYKMCDHMYTRETVRTFLEDSRREP